MFDDIIRRNTNLLIFRRDSRVLLAAGPQLKPLYIPEGGQYIEAFIQDAQKIGWPRDIMKRYPNDAELLKLLLEHDVLCAPGDSDTLEVVDPVHQQTEEDNWIDSEGRFESLSLFMLLTQFCNQACIYCLNGEATYDKASKRKMDERTAFEGINYFSEKIQPGGVLNIVFFGGEPLLNWPLARKIITYTQNTMHKSFPEVNYTYHLTTNLSLFPSNLTEWALRNDISFLVNVDGPETIHDKTRPLRAGGSSFRKTRENLRALANAGITFEMRATVTSVNQDILLDVAQIHRELGGTASALIPVVPVTSDEYFLPSWLLPDPEKVAHAMAQVIEQDIWGWRNFYYANQYGERATKGAGMKWPCGAINGGTPVLDVNGDIYACIYMVGMSRFRTGNIFDRTRPYPDSVVVGRMRHDVDQFLLNECAECSFKYICGGGCPVGMFLVRDNEKDAEGTFNYWKSVTCAVQHALLEEVLWKIGEQKWQQVKDEGSSGPRTCV